MSQVYKKYVKETLDKDGNLVNIEFNTDIPFNFAYDVVDYLGENKPDKKAMVWVSNDLEDRVFTFKDMMEYSNKVANFLYDKGVRKGDKVMVVLKRHYEFWFVMVALCKIGAVAIPATNQLTKDDFVYRFNKALVSGIIITKEGTTINECDKALVECENVKLKVCVSKNSEETKGYFDFSSEIEKYSSVLNEEIRFSVDKNDIMLMYFTSGTTSYPKIAAHGFSYPLGHIVTAKYWHCVKEDGVHFTISDTGWGKAVWGKLYGQWLCEAAVFTYDFDKFEPKKILPMFEKYKITTFCAPPTMYRFFLEENLEKYDLSSLTHASTAGEALNPHVFDRFFSYTNLKLMEGFGQTETTLTIATLKGMTPKPGSMGRPNPQYDIDIVDIDGNTVKPGEVGEIVVNTTTNKTCGIFLGYYLDEEKTKEAWYDGVYHTGDTAWYDEDGYYWFVGRKDDLIKSSGYRIGPFEVENVIIKHDSVLEVAVIGVPDEIRGQAIKAIIVLKNGYTKSEELKKDIQNFVKQNTAPYKYPRVIEFVDALPKTISGKVRRGELREEK